MFCWYTFIYNDIQSNSVDLAKKGSAIFTQMPFFLCSISVASNSLCHLSSEETAMKTGMTFIHSIACWRIYLIIKRWIPHTIINRLMVATICWDATVSNYNWSHLCSWKASWKSRESTENVSFSGNLMFCNINQSRQKTSLKIFSATYTWKRGLDGLFKKFKNWTLWLEAKVWKHRSLFI